MFTGIVEHVGRVVGVDHAESGSRLMFEIGPLRDVGVGDSIAVNGVCLTVVESVDARVSVSVVTETLGRSTLGSLRDGDRVNLERAMSADGRFDGHIVQGHVDGTGKIVSIQADGDGKRMTVAVPYDLKRLIVDKGSITVDGVSLTIAKTTEAGFEAALIPHTLEVTTLGLLKAGDEVNLEADVLAKYVERLMEIR